MPIPIEVKPLENYVLWVKYSDGVMVIFFSATARSAQHHARTLALYLNKSATRLKIQAGQTLKKTFRW